MSAYIQAVNQSKLLTARSLGLTAAECFALSDSYREHGAAYEDAGREARDWECVAEYLEGRAA